MRHGSWIEMKITYSIKGGKDLVTINQDRQKYYFLLRRCGGRGIGIG